MRRFASVDPKATWVAAAWLLSSVVAIGFIWITLQKSPDTIVLPADFEKLIANNDVLIGSSLSLAALPDDELYADVLSPERPTFVASLLGISEAHSIYILNAAVTAGAHTILLEANAFSHEFSGMRHHPMAATLASTLLETSKRLTMSARAAAGLPAQKYARVRLGRLAADRKGFLLAAKSNPVLFPRSVWNTAGLEQALAHARQKGTRVLLFWPPLPKGGFGHDPVRYAEIKEHVKAMAEHYDLPLWTASTAWPDEFFMDNHGHLNASGRLRFADEIGSWANSL